MSHNRHDPTTLGGTATIAWELGLAYRPTRSQVWQPPGNREFRLNMKVIGEFGTGTFDYFEMTDI